MQALTTAPIPSQHCARRQSGPRRFNLVTLFDLRQDRWLGDTNSLRAIARGHSASNAIAIRKDGSYASMRKATNALRHAQAQCPTLDLDHCDQAIQELADYAGEYRMQELLQAAHLKFWRSQADGASIGVWYFRSIGRDAETVTKTTDKDSLSLMFAHKRNDPTDQDYTHGWSKRLPPTSAVFLTPQALTTWKREIDLATGRAGLEPSEYSYSVGNINDEVLRLSVILGSKAVPIPFDVEARQASVTAGRTRIIFEQNCLDEMDIRAEVNGRTVAVRENLVSPRMAMKEIGSAFFAVTYSLLGRAGYEVWRESKMDAGI